jgi:hypothetical protein
MALVLLLKVPELLASMAQVTLDYQVVKIAASNHSSEGRF